MGKTEISIDPTLLAAADAAGLPASAIAEAAIRRAVARLSADDDGGARAAQWAAANAVALEAHRAQIERDGVFGQDLRTW